MQPFPMSPQHSFGIRLQGKQFGVSTAISGVREMFDARPADFEDHAWQERNSITRFSQLEGLLSDIVPGSLLNEIESGLRMVGMSLRVSPYILSLIDWSHPESDPIRRQFIPMRSELEEDHPILAVDSLSEREQSPVSGLVHRYPDKALFLVTAMCPVYCQFCTRSYAVGMDTPLITKDSVVSIQHWAAALDYIRATPQIEDIVVSGGDLARLKPSHIRSLGIALLGIDHVRRIRFATKALSVQPMKFLSDQEWLNAIIEITELGRSLFKDVCIHTHFNHPREITPLVERAMRRLHQACILVRNQTVLLRGVNDDSATLIELARGLGRINIHPYYVYLCDMVRATEHFRVALGAAQQLEKEVRGATAGFNTPLFIVDTPCGKRDIHSAEFYDKTYGISGFASPRLAPGRMLYYFDPLRVLTKRSRAAWRTPGVRERMMPGGTLLSMRKPRRIQAAI
jgi:lysine 2,3-aminomutase